MKWLIGFILLIASISFTARQIATSVAANFNYERNYGQLWELGVKSSTIEAKAQYLDDFYNTLVKGKAEGKFAENDAVYLKQPNNSFDANLSALHTLSERLKEIKGMNPNTFEYNTAIQQITAQEQGEAHAMLGVFQGCYELASYSNVWRWYFGIWLTTIIILWIATFFAFVWGCDFW